MYTHKPDQVVAAEKQQTGKKQNNIYNNGCPTPNPIGFNWEEKGVSPYFSLKNYFKDEKRWGKLNDAEIDGLVNMVKQYNSPKDLSSFGSQQTILLPTSKNATFSWSVGNVKPETETGLIMRNQYADIFISHFKPHRLSGSTWKSPIGNPIIGEKLEKVKVYVFFLNDFVSQTEKLVGDLMKKQMYSEGEIAISEITNVTDFKKAWSLMNGSPELVVINSHGKNQSLNAGHESKDQLTATGDGLTNISGTKVGNIQDLSSPKADFSQTNLQLNTCHANDTKPEEHDGQGALKGTKHTLAQAFLAKFKFKSVRASKDSVGYIHSLNSGWYWGISDHWEVGDPYPEDSKWDHLSLKGASIETVTEETD